MPQPFLFKFYCCQTIIILVANKRMELLAELAHISGLPDKLNEDAFKEFALKHEDELKKVSTCRIFCESAYSITDLIALEPGDHVNLLRFWVGKFDEDFTYKILAISETLHAGNARCARYLYGDRHRLEYLIDAWHDEPHIYERFMFWSGRTASKSGMEIHCAECKTCKISDFDTTWERIVTTHGKKDCAANVFLFIRMLSNNYFVISE